MAVWYVQQSDENEVGPLRPAELLQMVRKGTVKPETQIRKDDSVWFSASTVGGLFEAARRPTIENHCPRCEALINAPPTTCGKCDMIVTEAKTRIIENNIAGETPVGGTKPPKSVKNWLNKVKKKKDA